MESVLKLFYWYWLENEKKFKQHNENWPVCGWSMPLGKGITGKINNKYISNDRQQAIFSINVYCQLKMSLWSLVFIQRPVNLLTKKAHKLLARTVWYTTTTLETNKYHSNIFL